MRGPPAAASAASDVSGSISITSLISVEAPGSLTCNGLSVLFSISTVAAFEFLAMNLTLISPDFIAANMSTVLGFAVSRSVRLADWREEEMPFPREPWATAGAAVIAAIATRITAKTRIKHF